MHNPTRLEPCVNCKTCQSDKEWSFRDVNGKFWHIGNQTIPEWQIEFHKQAITYKDIEIELTVATSQDVEEILENAWLFPPPSQPDPTRALLLEFTRFTGQSYPYVCLARLEGQIAGKLFLDRNANNSIRRNLDAAVIDHVKVKHDFEEKGIGTSLISFAESLCQLNGKRWIEIGVMNAPPHRDIDSLRRGSDALRGYIRQGYYKEAVLLDKPLDVIYTYTKDSPSDVGNAVCPRYGKAIVVYKDLQSQRPLNPKKQKEFYNICTTMLSN